MSLTKTIADNIYYVGVNDRQKELFENYLPLPQGVSYNSYLIVDEKVALIDTVDISFAGQFLNKLEEILNGHDVDYLIVNHMEPDHAGSIGLLKNRYPNLQIVGNKKTFDFLRGYFSIDTQLVEVTEGAHLTLGEHELAFYMAPMVHWPEVMVTYEITNRMLFSADAFGTFGALNGSFLDADLDLSTFWDEMRRYYACIVGKYGQPTQNALKKLGTLPIQRICSTHGPVWSNQIDKVVKLYEQWSRYEAEKGVVVVYGSMYGNTQLMAERVACGIVDGGVKNVVVHNVSKTDASFILSDIFKYQGLVIGSPTYMGELYPLIDSLLTKIRERGIKNRIYGCFGSHSWATGAVKKLTAFGETMNWEVAGVPVDNKYGFSAESNAQCYEMGKMMGESVSKSGRN
ncbi:MAG TPA: FprA family A-type flavoprotein [Bacteroidales bacterium]|nr:FprA family A-type flavoprotein [Bacteroidales bacterium]